MKTGLGMFIRFKPFYLSLLFLIFSIVSVEIVPLPNQQWVTGVSSNPIEVKVWGWSIDGLGIRRAQATTPANNIAKAVESCQMKAKAATTMCVAESSEAMKTVVPMLSLSLPLLKQMDQMGKGSDEICEQGISVFDAIEKALIAYSVACGAAKALCYTTCASSIKIVNTEAPKAWPSPALAVESQKAVIDSINKQQAICGSYEQVLKTAIPSALNHMISNKQRAMSCKKQVQATACEQDPSALECIDCTKAENAGNLKCICLINPRSPGCASFTKQSDAERNTLSIGAMGDDEKAGPFINPTGADAETQFGSPSDGVSTGGGGGASGGGGGGGGGLGGSPSGSDGNPAGQQKSKGLSANIIGSEGGGGGRGGSGSGGDFLTDSNNPYAKFLPKAQDAEREPANIRQQITGAFGPSNFEKVSQRYKAIRWSTLDQSK
jgi:hypothetical protein